MKIQTPNQFQPPIMLNKSSPLMHTAQPFTSCFMMYMTTIEQARRNKKGRTSKIEGTSVPFSFHIGCTGHLIMYLCDVSN